MIDEKIADLITALWKFGLQTVDCCQGGTESVFEWAWIQFKDIPDGVRFLEGTGYLGDWRYADGVHLYLAPPLIPRTGPSSVVLMNYKLLPEITSSWVEGTVKPPQEEQQGD